MRVYKDNSNPLEEIPIGDIKDGETYIVETGQRVIYDENMGTLKIVQNSALNLGEDVKDLEPGPKPKSLGLYWTLMNKKSD